MFAAAAACLAAGCASVPSGGWALGDFGDSAEAERYSDYIAARYAALTDDAAAAALHARRALERDPADATLLERAVVASLLAGEGDEASALVRGAAPAQLADAPFASLTRIAQDIAANRVKPALERLNQPGAAHSEAGLYLAAWLAPPADLDAALARLAPEIQRGPAAAEPEAVAGLALAGRGRTKDALAYLQRAWRHGDHTPEAVAAQIRLLAGADDKRAAKVLADFRAEVGYDPEVEAAAAGEPARPLSAQQGAAQALTLVGRGALLRSRPELATLYLTLALVIEPDLAPARIALADALRQQGRPADALAALDKVRDDSIYRGKASMAEAFIREDMQDHDGARRAAAAALSRARVRDLLVEAGDLYREQERHAEAEALYDEAQKLDEANGRADWRLLFARGAERDKLGRWQDAEADLKRALELEPDRPELLNFLGYAWVQRGGDVRAGLALIEKAAARRPDQGYIVDSLGWAHYRLGDYDEAVRQLERAAELSPSDPDINDHLGDAYWRVGRRQDADYSWRRALTLDPSAELAASLKQKLESGLADQPRPRALAGAAEPSRP